MHPLGSLFSPSDWQQGRQCKVWGRKTSVAQHGVKDSVLGLCLLSLCSCCKQGTRYGSFPCCQDDCLLDSPEHVADTGALIHHRVLAPQDPAQGLLWQVLSPNSEVWKTEGSEAWSEGSSLDLSFRDILEVITSSWIYQTTFFPIMPYPKETRVV